ncbi:MAG: S1 RNA-binding domain-containing protein [Vampirovibrionales bacterium]|nr:S1 RNA-binding domain-containing protein [Vampirovibrionales bacterium]
MCPVSKRFHLDETLFAPADTQAEFSALLERYDHSYDYGNIVKGTVVSLDASGAHVDIGAKMLGFVPKREIAQRGSEPELALEPGVDGEFFVLREDADEGFMVLSYKRVASAQNWEQVRLLLENDTLVECAVTSIVKGGVLVDILGLRGFVPSSQIRGRQPLETLIGQTLPLKVIAMDPQRNNLVLSNRKAVPDQNVEQRKDALDALAVGQVMEGEVIRLTDFGAFVNLGGIDGLLPLSQMSWRWVEHPKDVLEVGQTVKVEVISIDADRQRVSLSMKSQMKDPWQEVADVYGVGSLIENATVTRIKNFGAFVEIFPGVEALLSSRELVDYEQQTGEPLQPGKKITVHIFKFFPHDKRIGLTFRPIGGGQFEHAHAAPASKPAANRMPAIEPSQQDDDLPPLEAFMD